MIALIQATFPDMEVAERIAATLLDERLAACANLLPCRSLYRWQDRVERADEVTAQSRRRPNAHPRWPHA